MGDGADGARACVIISTLNYFNSSSKAVISDCAWALFVRLADEIPSTSIFLASSTRFAVTSVWAAIK